jgi:hypothetical protein
MKPIDEIPVEDERAARLLWALEMVRIGNIAVRKAQEENRRLGIPNWYEIDGMLVSDQPSADSQPSASPPASDKRQ